MSSFKLSLVLIDVDLMVRTGGTRVLFQALAEGPTELISLIAMAFLYIVDAPKTRAYMHPGTDLEVIYSVVILIYISCSYDSSFPSLLSRLHYVV